MAWQKSPGTGPVINLVKKYEDLDDRITALLGYRPTDADMAEFPYNIYSFIIQSLRNLDQDPSLGGTQLLYRFLMGKNEIFYLLKQNVDNLTTLFSPDDIASIYLDSLLELVGFTSDLPQIVALANESEKRRIASGATLFWKSTLQDLGVTTGVRLITGNRFKYRDYIDFKNIIGEQSLTEELEGDDPYLLTADTLGTFENDVDGISQYGGSPNKFSQAGDFIFTQDYIGAQLVITGDTGTPSNDGWYEILNVNVPTKTVTLDRAFPAAQTALTFAVFFPYNEYIQELRVADYRREYDGVVSTSTPTYFSSASASFTTDDIGQPLRILSSENGQNGSWEISNIISSTQVQLKDAHFDTSETGLLWSYTNASINRTLLEETLELQRPGSERINVVYVDMIDRFIDRGDYSQWDIISGLSGTPISSIDNGYLSLTSTPNPLPFAPYTAGYQLNKTYSDYWKNYIWKTKLAFTQEGVAELRFLIKDSSDYLSLEVGFGPLGGYMILYQYSAGSVLGDYLFPALNLNTYWTYTIRAFNTTGNITSIVVELDGVPVIGPVVTSGLTWNVGTVGYSTNENTIINISETELYRTPVEVNRVGPNP